MPRVCSICNDRNRLAIDRDICEGRSFTSIARDTNHSSSAISRHAKYHLSRQLSQSYAKKTDIENTDLLARLDEVIRKAETIFDRNFNKNHDGLALKALAEQRQVLELLCRISAFMHQQRADELMDDKEIWKREQDQQLEERMKILSTADLRLLRSLSEKVQAQDSTIEIKAESEPIWPEPQLKRTRPAKSKDIEEPEPEPERAVVPSEPSLSKPQTSRERQRGPFSDEVTWMTVHEIKSY